MPTRKYQGLFFYLEQLYLWAKMEGESPVTVATLATEKRVMQEMAKTMPFLFQCWHEATESSQSCVMYFGISVTQLYNKGVNPIIL